MFLAPSVTTESNFGFPISTEQPLQKGSYCIEHNLSGVGILERDKNDVNILD